MLATYGAVKWFGERIIPLLLAAGIAMFGLGVGLVILVRRRRWR